MKNTIHLTSLILMSFTASAVPTAFAQSSAGASVTSKAIMRPVAAPDSAVQTLPSGVVVKHLKRGTGAQPTATDNVTVNYRGTLANGTEFDSSYKRGQPASFNLSQVIPCWTQGVQQMKVGAKVELTCPGATAYGPLGIPDVIPANATLTFQVELLSVAGK